VAATSGAALRKALKGGNLGGVFFLWGDEGHLIEEAVQMVVEAHLDPGTRDFNLDQLRGTQLDVETLASICQTPPMMSEWRVVVIRDAQALAANARTRSLLDDLAEPVPGLALVIAAHIEGKAAKTWEKLANRARSVRFAQLSAGELPDWLMSRAGELGSKLDPKAARALAATAGPELGRLAQELTKLIDYAGDGGTVDVAAVEKLVGYVPKQTRWDWIELVGERNFAEARASLEVILDSDSAVGLIIGLGTQLLRVAACHAGGENALAELLPGNQKWLVSKFRKQARKWTGPELDAALEDLLRADRLLKSTSLNDRQVLEELLLRLEGRRRAAA
jgi:DNA polymerase-3 subunit delta